VNELVDLERFVGRDLAVAEEAFLRMTPKIERFLMRYLAQLLPRFEDREDVIAQTISKLWQRRTSFEIQGIPAWWSYVAKTGRRCGLTKLGESSSSDLAHDVPMPDWITVELLAQYSDDRRRLYRAADQLWLCLDPEVSPLERNRRLLAAQLVFLHGVPARDVRDYLGDSSGASRADIDSWLASESTLLDLSYHSLFWENSALTAHLLELSSLDQVLDFDWWIAQAEQRPSGLAPNGMSWNEVAVIIWRYQFGMITEKIMQRASDLDPLFVDRVIAETEERMPCVDTIKRLSNSLSVSWVRSSPLTNPGLWKRLAFQYCVHSGLPQKQILQCTQPAAEAVGHKITKGMLNVWLSNGRLFAQLASYAREAGI
jgi:DNA-directed RNA polymerase specialized sigma24 family protein